MLFSTVNNPELSAKDLNDDLETNRKWAFQWKLEFNPDVNKQATEILFSRKTSSKIHPKIYFNGNEVVRRNDQKHSNQIFLLSNTFLIKLKKLKNI